MAEKNNYNELYVGKNGQQVGEEVLKYFRDLFSMEMPLGRMMGMMPGMIKYATSSKDNRQNLKNFMPQMMPMMKQAMGFKPKE